MDTGLQAVRTLRDGLMMEEQWVLDRERGFSWIAHNLVQHIDASPVFASRETDVSLITVRTPVVRNSQQPREKIDRSLLALNSHAVGSALIFDGEGLTVESVLAHQVHEQSAAFRVQQIYLLALLQLTHAENAAEPLAHLLDGVIASDNGVFASHEEPHEILGLPSELITPEMASPSRFAERYELESVYQMVHDTALATDGWWDGGITIEVPFGDHDTSLIELRNDVEHPSLGAGLAVRTTLRTEFLNTTPAELAVDLQRRQMLTVDGGGQLGAWGFRSDLDFAHVAWSRFLPNVMFRAGLSADVAMGEINRALWCDEILFPGLPQRGARELMITRDKLRADAAKTGFMT